MPFYIPRMIPRDEHLKRSYTEGDLLEFNTIFFFWAICTAR
jgi:hypothetical protein